MAASSKGSLRLCVTLLMMTTPAIAVQEPETPNETDPPEAAIDQDTPSLEVVREELSVTSRPLESETSSVTVIDAAAIQAAGTRTAVDLLRQVAGIHILSTGARGGRATAQMRGGDTNFTLVLLDGVPLNNSTDIEGGAFDFSTLPVDHIERIEIVRGPHSYYFGSTALAGVVNFVTKRGTSEEPDYEAQLEAGSGSLLRGVASVGARKGRADYFVGLSWEEESERVAEESFEQFNLQGSLGLQLAEDSSLRLTARATDLATEDYPDASGGPVYGSGELRDSDLRQYTLGALLEVGDQQRWNNSLSLAWDRQDLDRQSPAVFPLVPPSVEETTYSRGRLGWLSQFNQSEQLRFTGGLEVEREDGVNSSLLLLPPFLGGAIEGDYDLARTTPAAYAELALDRGPLFLEAGVRADFPEDRDTEWSPRLGVHYRFRDSGVALRASWSRAFKLPSFFALASPPALGGNPDLEPEASIGVDLGIELEPSTELSAGVTLFDNQYKNLIDFDFDLFRHVNRASVDAQGVEAYVRWKAASGLRIWSDLMVQSVEDPSSDQPLLQIPDWKVSLQILWDPTRSLHLKLEGLYVDESLDRQIPVPQLDRVDSYTVFHLAATWEFIDRWQLRVRVENLTDEEYEHFIGFPEPGIGGRVGVRFSSK